MKLDLKTLGYIKVFEKHTGADIKDCFLRGDTLVFIVKPGNIGKAIGKKGMNVRNLLNKFKRPLRIIEYNEDVARFVKNLIFPIKTTVETRGNKVVIFAEDNKIKGQLFGRDKSKLKDMQEIVRRYFDVEIAIE